MLIISTKKKEITSKSSSIKKIINQITITNMH